MKTTAAFSILLLIVWSRFVVRADADTFTLGEQDFSNGQVLTGADIFNFASAGEPAPFDQAYGNDAGASFSQSWTFNYPPSLIASAMLSIGIVDHDSQASGSQIASFDLEGNDLTSVLDGLFESFGGANLEANVYAMAIPVSALGALSDGSATFNLALKGPGLSDDGETTGNAAGLDFARLDVTPVPEPSGFAMLLAIGLTLALWPRDRRLHADLPRPNVGAAQP